MTADAGVHFPHCIVNALLFLLLLFSGPVFLICVRERERERTVTTHDRHVLSMSADGTIVLVYLQ